MLQHMSLDPLSSTALCRIFMSHNLIFSEVRNMSSSEEVSWISWFCGLRGNEFFCEVSNMFPASTFSFRNLPTLFWDSFSLKPFIHNFTRIFLFQMFCCTYIVICVLQFVIYTCNCLVVNGLSAFV